MSNHCVLVCGESNNGILDERTLELAGAGKTLAADMGVDLSVVIIGDNVGGAADEVSFFGVDNVYKIEHPMLETFDPDLWAQALDRLCRQLSSGIVLMLHTPVWMDVAPRLAFGLDAVLTTDCVDLQIDPTDKLLSRTKPVFGGSALAVFKYDEPTQLVTVRRNVMKPAERGTVQGKIMDVEADVDPSMTRVQSVRKVKEETVALDKADVIVAGGNGIGGPEGFKELEDLADALKKSFDEVMVGCSRPVVDAGWKPSSHQIGLSGAMVQPDLYIAVGISGAIQHLVGMARSRKIVAVNTDPACSIFTVADYGVVEDYRKVVPALKAGWEELCRERDEDTGLR
ncbi:MAG: electron transfer flavoprotein subunit alpha/FixB family protein [Pseudomonadota bacterium]